MSRTLLFIEKTRNDDDDEDDNVDHAKKGRKVGREAMIPNDTVMWRQTDQKRDFYDSSPLYNLYGHQQSLK